MMIDGLHFFLSQGRPGFGAQGLSLYDVDIRLTFFAIIAFILIGIFLTAIILFTKRKMCPSRECTVFINDDPNLTFKVREGTALLSVLTANKIPIPSPCGGKATCKQCKVKVLEGGSEILEVEKDSFSKKQQAEGWRLSCQCKVKGDMSVHVPDHLLDAEEIIGEVLSNNNVATFIKELTVEIPHEISYRSGGYMQFHTPPFKTRTDDWKETIGNGYVAEWEKWGFFGKTIDYSHPGQEVLRAYSMASYPAEGKKLIFNIRIATPPINKGKLSKKVPWGACSSYLFSLKKGDKVRMSGPYGESFMIDDNRELVFLIGGAGSSFARSHILHLFRTEKTQRKVTLWYGARSLKENIYQKEYEEIARDSANFRYYLVLSEPREEDRALGWDLNDPVKTNFLFKAFEEGHLKQMKAPEECLYYVCGPALHNASVLKLLDDYGVPRENIVLDDFGI